MIHDDSEFQLVQTRYNESAAGGLSVSLGSPGVPLGKIWTVYGVGFTCSVNESQIYSVFKVMRTASVVGLLNPLTLNLNPSYGTCIEQGNVFLLLPGEYITINRHAATAGSIIIANLQFVESDMPLYEYIEPQEKKRLGLARASFIRRAGGGGGRGPASRAVPPRPGPPGPGRER